VESQADAAGAKLNKPALPYYGFGMALPVSVTDRFCLQGLILKTNYHFLTTM